MAVAASPLVVIDDEPTSDTVQAIHSWQILAGQRVSVWEVRALNNPDTARRLRMMLSHLHAEITAFERILGACQTGLIDPDAPAVRDVIQVICSALTRGKRYGFLQHGYIRESIDLFSSSHVDWLDALDVMARSVTSKGLACKVRNLAEVVRELAPPTAATTIVLGDNVGGDRFETHIDAQNIGPTAIKGNVHSSGLTQSASAGVPLDGDELARLLEQMRAEASSLRGKTPPETADAAEEVASEICDDLEVDGAGEKAARKLRNFLGLATAAGATGSALAAAITAVREALGLV